MISFTENPRPKNHSPFHLSIRAGGLVLVGAILWQAGMLACVAEETKPQTQYVYKTIGNRKLTLDLDYPTDWKSSDKRPAIVFFFGGGWAQGSPVQFKPQADYLAKRGLVCARADYRVRSKDGVSPDKCVEDALSALRWVRSHATELGVDTNRIVAAGGSAGGHLAACTFFAEGSSAPDDDKSVSPKPNALVLYNPVLDLADLRNGQGRQFFSGLNDETLKRISPLLHVGKEMPPTLLIDGTEDFLNAQVRQFVQKSKALGAPVEAWYAEGQPHGFFNKSPWLEKTTQQVDDFLCRIGYLAKDPRVSLPTRGAWPELGPARK
jgi:acetyl esterase